MSSQVSQNETLDSEDLRTSSLVEKSMTREASCLNNKEASSNDDSNKESLWKVYLLKHQFVPNEHNPSICNVCYNIYLYKHRPTRSMFVHDGVKKFPCDKCDKVFKTAKDLTTHIIVHELKKPEKNILCNKRFTNTSDNHDFGNASSNDQSLKRKLSHTGVKMFTCDHCNRQFLHKSSLKTHMLIHTGKKPFSCDLCDKRFLRSSNLKAHKLLHSGVKQFSCDQCDKRFLWSSNLKVHKLLHSGVKPFSCDQCDKSFSRAEHLKIHKRVHSGVKPFPCDQCDKSFSRAEHLKIHKRVHSGVKPFPCDQCDKKFSQKQHLKRHKRIHMK